MDGCVSAHSNPVVPRGIRKFAPSAAAQNGHGPRWRVDAAARRRLAERRRPPDRAAAGPAQQGGAHDAHTAGAQNQRHTQHLQPAEEQHAPNGAHRARHGQAGQLPVPVQPDNRRVCDGRGEGPHCRWPSSPCWRHARLSPRLGARARPWSPDTCTCCGGRTRHGGGGAQQQPPVGSAVLQTAVTQPRGRPFLCPPSADCFAPLLCSCSQGRACLRSRQPTRRAAGCLG
jgi:hypothetical protein